MKELEYLCRCYVASRVKNLGILKSVSSEMFTEPCTTYYYHALRIANGSYQNDELKCIF